MENLVAGRLLRAFGNIYDGKTVLVTGNTGFKGAWLTVWLRKLGARVIGLSKDVPTEPSIFEVLRLGEVISHNMADIRDMARVREIVEKARPDFVFHLAAQPIVSTSYANPVETVTTNVGGTTHILEALRTVTHPCAAVLITSDKCYDNVEWEWGYRENDRLGGRDIYSGSKGAAELVIRSYVESFFRGSHPVRIGVARAGNVIGGGDWARDRLVADCIRAWSRDEPAEIRSPKATRPWQHVLEPLSGYLALGQALWADDKLHGEAFNFGPRAETNPTVMDVLRDLAANWGFNNLDAAVKVTASTPFHEASLLKLNCDKALFHLKWEANLVYSETIALTGSWYSRFYRKAGDMYAFTVEQIETYERCGRERARIWAAS